MFGLLCVLHVPGRIQEGDTRFTSEVQAVHILCLLDDLDFDIARFPCFYWFVPVRWFPWLVKACSITPWVVERCSIQFVSVMPLKGNFYRLVILRLGQTINGKFQILP